MRIYRKRDKYLVHISVKNKSALNIPLAGPLRGFENSFENEFPVFPEINIDSITRILGMNITFVTSAETDEEGYALLKEFGLPFKNSKKD